jgi:YYY domain-containing protein
MACATFFRFYGRMYDQGTWQNPDEMSILNYTTPQINWPSRNEDIFDWHVSTLNTRRDELNEYPWGAFPIYLERATGWLLDSVLPPTSTQPDGYWVRSIEGIAIIGRSLASIFDLITVLLVFLVARRLYSSGTALIAAALYGFAVTAIQIAHFFIVESFLVTFIMGAVYFSVVLMQRPRWWVAVAAGACLGLAVACKISVLPIALVIVAAVVLRAVYRKRTRRLGAEFGDPVGVSPATTEERERSFGGHLLGGAKYVLLAAVFSLLAFAVGEPYVLWSFDFSTLSSGGLDALIQSNPWSRRIRGEQAVQSGLSPVPFTRQYIGTAPVVYQLEQMVFWGMGLVPGLMSVIGALAAFWQALRRRPAEILLLSAGIPYFLTIATLLSKWMRYMLPLVPIFCILGAAFLVRGAIWSRKRFVARASADSSRRAVRLVSLQRGVFPALIALSIGWAFLWAVAFMNVYSQPHSRVQASEWIHDNVPREATLATEHWDYGLPISLPPRNGQDRSGYPTAFEMELYNFAQPDLELERIKTWLRRADYIIMSSNRLYGSIPRLPWQYPVQSKYYELLFAEKLGFVSANTTQVTPELFGIAINDQPADESFTVYDHPRVDVFKKVSELTDDQYRMLFSTALNRPIMSIDASNGKVEDDKGLSYTQPVNTLPQLDDYAWNPLGQEQTQWFAVALWLLLVEALGLLALPVVFTVFRNVPDRGYAVAKLAALLMIAWGMWIAASTRVIPFTIWGLLLMVGMLAALSTLCWRLGAGSQIREFFRTKRNLVLAYEAVFLVAFAGVLALRMANPDLWHTFQGGEKPMEIGFLNAVLRSPWMPALDPFFAGGFINYYYYGYFIIACLVKLLGIHPAIAFNLAVPLFYALTFTAGMSVVYNLVAWSQRRRGSTSQVSQSGIVFGALAGFLMLVIGNMHGLIQWVMITFPDVGRSIADLGSRLGFGEQSMYNYYPSFNYWDASRIINDTINEFPYWTFLFADLHPHLINMPFTVMAVLFILNLVLAGAYRKPLLLVSGNSALSWWQASRLRVASTLGWLWGSGATGALTFVLFALNLGALLVINSWDFPTYLGLAGGGAVVALLLLGRPRREWQAGAPAASDTSLRSHLTFREQVGMYGTALASVGLLAGLSLLAYLPFFLNFKAFYTAINALVDGGRIADTAEFMHRTTVGEFLVVWGLFVFIAASYLVYRLWHFPWTAAVDSLMGVLPRAAERPTTDLAPQQAFTLFGSGDRQRQGSGLVPALALPQGAPLPLDPVRFVRGSGEGTLDEQESTQEVDGRAAPEGTPPTNGPADSGGNGAVATTTDGNGNNPSSGGWLSAASAEADKTLKVRRRVTLGAVTATPFPGLSDSVDDSELGMHEVAVPAQSPVARTEAVEPGLIPLWAGLGLLGITAGLVVLQMVTGQWLLALLVALLGGIAATTLSTSRTAGNLFCGLLMMGALAVATGVELVYLADHLSRSDKFRMNTVFKFYMQVWVLWALAGASAIYYMLFGLREHALGTAGEREERLDETDSSLSAHGASVPTSSQTAVNSASHPAPRETQGSDGNRGAEPENWLVWSMEHASDATDVAQVEHTAPAADRVSGPAPLDITHGKDQEQEGPAIRWTVGRLVWLGAFALLLMSSLAFTFLGTPDRLVKRFGATPPAGTLNGLAFMTSAVFTADIGPDVPPVQVNLKYDYEAINWLNSNVKGAKVLAELPVEYYRAYGMRAAANTGLPMVVGGLHQEEQRYGWLVGDRRSDMNTFFTTPDVQVVLTLLSKYDIDYIYLGQLEQARAGATGMRKFEQLADPDVNILREVFRTQQPEGIAGTIIYEVVRDPARKVSTLVGAPVANSGIPGVSFTPIPAPTATPMPTPPTDDPELRALLDLVALDPLNRDNRFKLVDWYRQHNFPLDAARELETLVTQDPSNVALRHMLGDAYQQGGEPDKALKAWEDARDIDVNNPAGHNKVGIAYLDRKRMDDAIREFQATVERDPRFVEAYYHMGQAYQLKGDRENAIASYQKVIDNAPAGAEGWVDAARQRLTEVR